ncbi:MAG: Mrp/NBP35 family ATP-binding protein [Candidatus Altiarchaeota archaeon]|nr:Mrp/NBP35 family ATP-binding protein [Candidatus Altiarchaeota archaeon]
MHEEAGKKIGRNMQEIKNRIAVLSGKGGVGKTTVAVNLALALHKRGFCVGILDADIHGPNVPKMLGIEGEKPQVSPDNVIRPVEVKAGGKEPLKVMSMAFFLEKDAPVIWRGPMKMGLIQQFLSDVSWGGLDYLIIDLPPGTGDEALSIAQLIPGETGAVIVSTPQEVALLDSGRSIAFAKKLNLDIIGIIENMSGYRCPHCGKETEIFKAGGVERMAKELDVNFLGSIPFDPLIVKESDAGKPCMERCKDSDASKAFETIVEKIAGSG